MNLRRWIVFLIGVGLIATVVSTARAQTGDADELAAVAKRAYGLGDYAFAVHAYKQAHEIQPEPALLYAIADAYRQRFRVDGRAYDRLQAVAYYQSYLDAVRGKPKAKTGRRERAQKALAELESQAPGVDDEEALAAAAEAELGKTRLAVTSQALGALARIDGGKKRKLPLFIDIAPGKHRVVVSAPGYQAEKRMVSAVRGFVHPVSVDLKPEAAKLTIVVDDGAHIHVDGRFVGVAPLDEPLEVEPGTRHVEVGMTGYELHTLDVTLKRGETKEIEIDLEVTGQRIIAATLLGVGSAGLATGIVFGVLSVIDHRAARDLNGNQQLPGQVNEEQERLFARRDDYRIGSGVAAGVGLGLFVVGGALFILDEPALPKAGRELTLVPVVGPRHAGASLSLRF